MSRATVDLYLMFGCGLYGIVCFMDGAVRGNRIEFLSGLGLTICAMVYLLGEGRRQ